MGDAKRRKEMSLPPRTVRFPALTAEEVQLIHHMMHHRLHELQATPPDQADENHQAEFRALQQLHHKLFAH